MVNIVISQNKTVTGDTGKIIAYEGNKYSEIINIVHPIFQGAQYFIEYKYDNTILRDEIDTNNHVAIKINDAGYIKCQFVALDIITGDAIFKSNYWYLIVKQSLKIEPSHHPCDAFHYHKYGKPIHIAGDCKNTDVNTVEMITKLYNELTNEEEIRFNENQNILQQISNILIDIDAIKDKLHIAEPDEFMKTLNINKIDDYLFDIHYDKYSYNTALEFFKTYKSDMNFGCSVVYNNNVIGRNFDFHYSPLVDFRIIVPENENRYGSVGVAHGTKTLINDFVESNKYHDDYNVLPYFTVDGMNTAGLIVTENVVPTNDILPSGRRGRTLNTNVYAKDNICNLMIPRLLLDNCATIDECITLLNGKNIYALQTTTGFEELHYLLADASGETAVIEFIYDDELGKSVMSVLRNEKLMTNFYKTEYVEYNDEHDKEESRASLTDHACGIERYDILKNNYTSSNTVRGMIDLMKSVYYTKAYNIYTNPFWYSEFANNYGDGSFGDLTKDNIGDEYLDGDVSKAGVYEPVVALAYQMYSNKKRDGKLWQTNHMSVYDWIGKRMIVLSQEGSIEHELLLSEVIK